MSFLTSKVLQDIEDTLVPIDGTFYNVSCYRLNRRPIHQLQDYSECETNVRSAMSFVQTAKANLEKAQSELVGVSDEAARAEVLISVEANEAIVKALE